MSASSVKTSSAASWSEDETSQGSECEWEADLERVELDDIVGEGALVVSSGHDLVAVVGGDSVVFVRVEADGRLEVLYTFTDRSGDSTDPEDGPEQFCAAAWTWDASTGAPVLAVAGTRRVIKIIDPSTGSYIGFLHGHGGASPTSPAGTASLTVDPQTVLSLSFSPFDPALLASCSIDRTVRVWDIDLATPPPSSAPTSSRSMSETSTQRSCTSSPEPLPAGTSLADHTKRQIASLSPAKRLEKTASEPMLGKSHWNGSRRPRAAPALLKRKGKRRRGDAKLKLPAWETPHGQLVAIMAGIRGHTAAVLSVAWHPLHPLVASSGADHAVKVWRVPDRPSRWQPVKGAPVEHFPIFTSSHVHEHWIDHVEWLSRHSHALLTRSYLLSSQTGHPFTGFMEERHDKPPSTEIRIWTPDVLDPVFDPEATYEPQRGPAIDVGRTELAFEELWRGSFDNDDVGADETVRRDVFLERSEDAVKVHFGGRGVSTVGLSLTAEGDFEQTFSRSPSNGQLQTLCFAGDRLVTLTRDGALESWARAGSR